MKYLFIVGLLFFTHSAQSRIKIGDNPGKINANTLLGMERSSKTYLSPQVTIKSITTVYPLTGIVPAGKLLYYSAGSLNYGYYYWNSSEWKMFSNGNQNVGSKTANTTSAKVRIISFDVIDEFNYS